jgi:carbonic anhydrase
MLEQGVIPYYRRSEGVTWFVLETLVEISAAQIADFAKRYPHDVRPVQPLNGRVVKASK